MSSRRRPRRIFFAAVVVAAACILPIETGNAASVPKFPSDLPSELEATVEEWSAAHDAHAVSATIRVPRRGLDWNHTTGDVKPGSPATADTQYRAGSATKTFTAAIVLQLVDQGRLSLDDPLSNWYPRYPNASQITVGHLLQQTSGIKEMQLEDAWFITLSALAVNRMWRPDELIEWSASPIPMWSLWANKRVERRPDPPGTVWRYAQPNYILAGRIIEKVTGQSYADNVRTRIAEPLGLKHTLVPATGDSPYLPGWTNLFGMLPTLLPTTVLPSYNAPFSAAWSAGGVVSTPADLSRFLEAVQRPGLLSAKSVKAMHKTVEANVGQTGSAGYGLGLFLLPLGKYVTWGHDGGVPGFTTFNRYVSACGAYVAVMTNTDDSPRSRTGEPPNPTDRRLHELGERLFDIVAKATGCTRT